MSNPKHTSDWLETQVKKLVREELAAQELRRAIAEASHAADYALLDVEAAAAKIKVEEAEDCFNLFGSSDCRKQLSVCLVGLGNCQHKFNDGCAVDGCARVCAELLGKLAHDGGTFFEPVSGFGEKLNLFFVHCQNSSPSRSGLSADTLSSPTMTVQENTGAGAVSPSVPAQPRFVAVGGYVYDRELDRTFATRDSSLIPVLLIERLNAGHVDVNTLLWEDAK